MAELVYPYTTAFLMDILGVETVEWDIVRFDEYDSLGTGHDIQAELADPKWTARMTMRPHYNLDARRIAARIRKLDGSAEKFMVYDPSNPYPYADPNGTILGASNVQINSIPGNNTSLTLKGLPVGYALTEGDKGQVNFGTDSVYFFEFSQDITANGSGVTPAVEVWPHIPTGLAINQVVILKKPACKMSIMPGEFRPGRSSGNRTSGITLNALEHI